MGICPNDPLNFNYGNLGDRAERVRNLIFRNGLDALLVRSIPCTGHTNTITNELQTFARTNYGLNSEIITKRIDTIILDGEIDLLGNTTYWDEPNTFVVTSTVALTGVTQVKTYEYLDTFTGANVNQTTDSPNLTEDFYQMVSAELTGPSTLSTEIINIGDEEIQVSSTVGFYEGAYIVIDKNAVNPQDVELFQIKYVAGSSLILRTPDIQSRIVPSTGIGRIHASGTTIHLVNVSEKNVNTDYSINLTSGQITLNSGSFNFGDLVFFNYEYNIYSSYSEGTDFTVDYEEGIVTRLENGSIPFGQTVEVAYNYTHPCLDPKTGAPRRNCLSCNGFGFISLPQERIRGLFHIPNYDSPLTQAGYWQMGDAFFTVPELSTFNDITAEPKGDEGFFVRDMLIIDNKYWLVMTKPQSFNLQNQFLGRKLHLRMISE